jgi:protocatechuate 3,4-dioxygenase beta subunit
VTQRYPAETAGPYPADGSNPEDGAASNALRLFGIVRNDIRSSFGASTTQVTGVPLTLTMAIVDTKNGGAPLAGCVVYIWQCTADGQYSLYEELSDENFLRGMQVTDGEGKVTFKSIFPGCYAQRYPHIHFEIYPSPRMATSYRNRILTSQIAMPRDVATRIYAEAGGYGESAGNLAAVTTSSDPVFGDNTRAQLEAMTLDLSGDPQDGYAGAIVIGVAH